MNSNSFIYDAIVPIHCGSKIGTAFFVEPDRLITARHVVSDALRNNTPVVVILKDTILICSKLEVLGTDSDLSDVMILTVNNYVHTSVLHLLSLPPKVKKKLFVAGYPLEIGNNCDLFDFEIHNSTTVTGNEYDVVASHSASIAHYNQSQIEYLHQSGLTDLEIKKVLKEAFINDINMF